MELEELQALWSEMSNQLETQKKLTHKIIMDMTQEKYSRKFQSFLHFEGIGAIICLLAAFWLFTNFAKLDTWYFVTMGIMALVLLTVLPISVIRSLYRIKNINIADANYRETLLAFTRAKKNLLFVQRMGINLSYVFALIILPLTLKLMKNKDLFDDGRTWLWFVPVFLLFIFFFSRWGYRCYLGATDHAEKMLKELE